MANYQKQFQQVQNMKDIDEENLEHTQTRFSALLGKLLLTNPRL